MQTQIIRVYGKVQGVFFRKFTKEKATELGLTGEVKNMPDGSVFIIVTGNADQLEALGAWCKKGHGRAIVSLTEQEEAPFQTFADFRILK